MVGTVVLLTVLSVFAGPGVVSASCSISDFGNSCGVSNTGSGVSVSVTDEQASGGSSGGGSSGGGSWSSDDSGAASGGGGSSGGSGGSSLSGFQRRLPGQSGGGGGGAAAAPAFPTTLSVSQVLEFAPQASAITVEPDGWGIVGAHTNAYTTASAHTASGTILGRPVTVSFVPASFSWNYGDGTTARTSTPGASWTALGLAPFAPTETSHAYAARGDVAVSVTVDYRASVNVAGIGDVAVAGTVPVTSAGTPLRLVESDQAITDGTCDRHPTAPGCRS